MIESRHFLTMLQERSIPREWVERALKAPDLTEERGDGTRHFLRRIPEFDHRWLRVVVNISENPNRLVTVFFDRRVGSAKG